MREYISVCGFSSVGKKTLIAKLLSGQLRDRFGLSGSVQAYGWAFEPLESIFDSSADHVLYQWQLASDTLIEELQTRFPDSSHRVILVWRPWQQHLRDWVAQYGHAMTGDPSVANIVDWWNEVIVPRFRDQLPALGIPVEIVNGATPDYDRLDWESIPAS